VLLINGNSQLTSRPVLNIKKFSVSLGFWKPWDIYWHLQNLFDTLLGSNSSCTYFVQYAIPSFPRLQINKQGRDNLLQELSSSPVIFTLSQLKALLIRDNIEKHNIGIDGSALNAPIRPALTSSPTSKAQLTHKRITSVGACKASHSWLITKMSRASFPLPAGSWILTMHYSCWRFVVRPGILKWANICSRFVIKM